MNIWFQECEHSEKDRALTGVWTTLELYKALELGYRLEKVFEVWHYDRWAKFDGKDPNTGLFTRYINSFLKLKAQASGKLPPPLPYIHPMPNCSHSGWPSWVESEEQKRQFVQQYEEREGIHLDLAKIEVNKAMRSLAKLCLNSFWGKVRKAFYPYCSWLSTSSFQFGQRDNQTQLSYFSDPAEFFKVIQDDTNVIQSVFCLNQEMVVVTHSKEEEFVDVLTNTNVVIAAYTTSQARLKLYSFLEQLGERALYMDTGELNP